MTIVLHHPFSVDGYGNSVPLTDVVIHGTSTRSVNLTALWDTGSSMTLLDQAYARYLGYVDLTQVPQRQMAGVGGNVMVAIVRVPLLTIRSVVEIRDVEIGFAPMSAFSRYQMLLGQSGVLSNAWLRHQSLGGGAGFFSFGARRPR